MASSIPSQIRTIDPFAAYNTNPANRLSRMVSHGEEGLLTPNSLQITIDTTSPTTTVVVSTGLIIKDDVLIQITEDHEVDFTDGNQYYTPIGTEPNVGGYYYIVLDYSFINLRTPNQASIRILKPSERSLLTTSSNLILLKVVRLSTSYPYPILSVHNNDPENTSNHRQYIKYYIGGSAFLPVFDSDLDVGRIIYSTVEDTFHLGFKTEWFEITEEGISINNLTLDSTSIIQAGMLCYIDSNGNAAPSIAGVHHIYGADLFIFNVDDENTTGKGLITGYGRNALVETGVIVQTGDLLYLSAADPGRVTNRRTENIYQVVGRALSDGNSLTPIDIIFSPKIMTSFSTQGQIDSWIADTTSSYYSDIDISELESNYAFISSFYDNATREVVIPETIEIRDNGNTLRVYVTSDSLVINYTISAGNFSSAGQTSSGSTSHATLLNLDYASSGHTGFSPDPHDNTYHSQNFIIVTGVNFTNLNNNGDVGTGADQLAEGNHVHIEYLDIPSSKRVLFESDVAISGYTLVTSIDDSLVYVDSTGGASKAGSTWSQPNHTHTLSDTGTDHSHTLPSHVLTIAEMPSHRHSYYRPNTNAQGLSGSTQIREFIRPTSTANSSSVGSNTGHTHDTDTDGNHDHGGTTGGSNTASTWRPLGRNYTIQQRI